LQHKETEEKNILFAMLMKETRAYMDRSLLEGNPHSIIEGMLIGALLQVPQTELLCS